MVIGGGHEAPRLTKEPLTVDSYWERRHQFSLRVWHLVGWPCTSGRSHIHDYMGRPNWTWWIKKKKRGHKSGKEGKVRVDLGVGRGEWLLSKLIEWSSWTINRKERKKTCSGVWVSFKRNLEPNLEGHRLQTIGATGPISNKQSTRTAFCFPVASCGIKHGRLTSEKTFGFLLLPRCFAWFPIILLQYCSAQDTNMHA